ncbi:MAG: T9SS type A sorting domain-containing protein [Bacteroidales bacterium]|nr:T9SS type A sorting domain-containing protein [Bacteroidales bacterium]
MKKVLSIATLLVAAMFAQAQTYAIVHVDELPTEFNHLHYCTSEYNGVVLYAHPYCSNFQWRIEGTQYQNLDSVVITATEYTGHLHVSVEYAGCGFYRTMYIKFHASDIPNPFGGSVVWMRPGETLTFSVPWDDNDYEWEWSNGSTDNEIEVTEPGIYSISIESLHGCGSATYSVEVRDNVEATLATTDLATNLNMVTWQTTDEQAEYVNQVKVYRDGTLVGTAPYADGSFTDNIGSEAASRTYTVLAVAPDGTDCPILSHPKETIHMTYTLGMGNTIVIGWNHPTGYDLVGYNICEWHPGAKDDELTVIDYVGAGVSSYTCSESQFDHGMIVVQGVERTKDAESRLLSNRSLDYVGLGEKENKFFNLYPNPTTGRVTIEGTGRLTITNTLGQTVLTRDITDTETIDLPMGVWFVKLDGATRKVVVE